MKKLLVFAATLGTLGMTCATGAQSMIPIPAFNRTYTANQTRGFFLQVPIDLIVTGLRVPDESQHGTQHVALYRNGAPPPAWTGTVPLTPVFSKYNTGSATTIACSVPFKKGEWLITIGACGDATSLRNSYAAPGCFNTTVLGQPTTLCRCGIQANIITAPTPHAVWSEVAQNVCRVEVYITSAASIVGSGTGAPGTAIDFTLTASRDAGLPYVVGSSLGKGPIPIDTRQLGLSPDDLLVLSTSGLAPTLFQRYVGILDNSGQGTAKLQIPNLPVLRGVRIYTAFLTLSASAPSGIASISNTFDFGIS